MGLMGWFTVGLPYYSYNHNKPYIVNLVVGRLSYSIFSTQIFTDTFKKMCLTRWQYIFVRQMELFYTGYRVCLRKGPKKKRCSLSSFAYHQKQAYIWGPIFRHPIVLSSWLPSGKHTKNNGKSPFLMGKSTISMAIFNSYVSLPEGISSYIIS